MKVSELFEEKERNILNVLGKQPEHYDGDFTCADKSLLSLKGAPKIVTGSFYCQRNYLDSLDHVPESMNYLNFYENELESLHNIHKKIKHCGIANFEKNPIKSHVLGLLLIKGLTHIWIDKQHLAKILNKHLNGERDVFACQEELIEKGFEEFAQL